MNLQLRLAWRYLMGRKLRTALTTLAIVFGVMVLGLSGTISAVQGSFRQSLMAAAGQVDLTVTGETRGVFDAGAVERVRNTTGVAYATGSLAALGSGYKLGGNVGAGPELAQAVRSTPGVAAVTTLRLSTARVEGQDLQVVGIDPTGYRQISGLSFTAGDAEQAYAALASERAMIVNGIFAGQSGVQVGQVLTLATPAGPQAYRVAGIGMDYLNYKLATGYISQANLARDFRETSDLLLLANRAANADPDVVHGALQGVAAGYPAFSLYSTEVFQQSQMQAFGAIVQALHLLVFVLAGLWLGYVLVGAMGVKGLGFPYSFPYAGLLLTLAAGLIFGVAGALIPARQAARLNVVAALQYE